MLKLSLPVFALALSFLSSAPALADSSRVQDLSPEECDVVKETFGSGVNHDHFIVLKDVRCSAVSGCRYQEGSYAAVSRSAEHSQAFLALLANHVQKERHVFRDHRNETEDYVGFFMRYVSYNRRNDVCTLTGFEAKGP